MTGATARFVVFLAVVLSIWLAEHLYVGWRLLSLPTLAAPPVRRAVVAVMIFGFLAYLAGRLAGHHGWRLLATVLEYSGGVWMGLVFLLLAAFLLVDLITVGGLLLAPRVALLRTAAAVAAVVLAAVAWVGGQLEPRVIRLTVTAPGLAPAADGVTLLQVSDLHLGTFGDQRRIATVLALVDRLRPDLVAITGDLVDGDVAAVEPLIPALCQIRAPRGVVAVLGNHEHYAGAAASTRLLTAAGFRVLVDDAVEVAPGLAVVGVDDDRGASQTGSSRRDLAAALSSVPAGAFVVLLQHSPEGEREAAAAGVGLMLSGHTHGGQVWPFHLLVRRAYPFMAGVREVAGMTQVVSRGAGLWGPPMRLFAPADVVLVTFAAAPPAGLSAPEAGAKVSPAPT